MDYASIVEEFLYESGILKGYYVDYEVIREMVKSFYDVMREEVCEEGCVSEEDIEGIDAKGLLAFAVWNYWYEKTGESLDMAEIRRAVENVVPSSVVWAVEEELRKQRGGGW